MSHSIPHSNSFCSDEASAQIIENLILDFGPSESVHKWCKLPECDEFVGSK